MSTAPVKGYLTSTERARLGQTSQNLRALAAEACKAILDTIAPRISSGIDIKGVQASRAHKKLYRFEKMILPFMPIASPRVIADAFTRANSAINAAVMANRIEERARLITTVVYFVTQAAKAAKAATMGAHTLDIAAAIDAVALDHADDDDDDARAAACTAVVDARAAACAAAAAVNCAARALDVASAAYDAAISNQPGADRASTLDIATLLGADALDTAPSNIAANWDAAIAATHVASAALNNADADADAAVNRAADALFDVAAVAAAFAASNDDALATANAAAAADIRLITALLLATAE